VLLFASVKAGVALRKYLCNGPSSMRCSQVRALDTHMHKMITIIDAAAFDVGHLPVCLEQQSHGNRALFSVTETMID
jgi:hypothetical protein